MTGIDGMAGKTLNNAVWGGIFLLTDGDGPVTAAASALCAPRKSERAWMNSLPAYTGITGGERLGKAGMHVDMCFMVSFQETGCKIL